MPEISVGEGQLHYADRGTGRPTLVFVHGIACDGTDWASQLSFFDTSHQAVAVDLRGHGNSTGFTSGFDIETMANDVCALLDSAGLAPTVVIGHSLGCRVVVEAVSRRPDLVAGAVLIDGSRSSTGDSDEAVRAAQSTVARTGIGPILETMFESMFFESSDPTFRQRALARALATPEAVTAPLFVTAHGYDAARLEGALRAITCPVLLVQSTEVEPGFKGRRSLEVGDTTVWTDWATSLLEDSRIEIIPGVGHFSMVEAADRVNSLIARFLNLL